MTRRVLTLLVAFYPPAFRRRYGVELTDLVAREQGSPAWRLGADLARGAAREWLGMAGLVGDRLTPRDRAGGGLARVVWSWGVFAGGLIALMKAQEQWQYDPERVNVGALNMATDAAVNALLLALLGIVTAGALVTPSLVVALRTGGWQRVRGPGMFAAVGSLALVAVGAGIVVWAHQLDAVARNGGNPAYSTAVALWVLAGVVVGGAWCVCVARLVRAAVPGRRVVIGASWASVVAGPSMMIVTVASAVPYLLTPGPPPNGVVALAVMGAAGMLAIVGAVPATIAAHRVT
jgi:hypothetical protein